MAQQDEKNEKKEDQKRKTTIDPYTGEEEPVPADAEDRIEIVPVNTGDRDGDEYLLREEDSIDSFTVDEDADEIPQQSAAFTEDEQIEQDFAERQRLAMGGRKELKEELEDHHSKSPRLSGGDIDAHWEDADQSGEETVGGTNPTPDQDVVDELGEAAGLTYEDDEMLESEEKILRRDRRRWELDPESAQEETAEAQWSEEE